MRIFVGDTPERGIVILIAWVYGMLYNQEEFDPKEKKTTEDPYPSAPVRAAQTSFTLFCSTPLVILVIKQKKQITFNT